MFPPLLGLRQTGATSEAPVCRTSSLLSFTYMYGPTLRRITCLSSYTVSFSYFWLHCLWALFGWRVSPFNRFFSICILFWRLNLFLLNFFILFLIFMQLPIFLPQGRRHATYKKGRRPRTTDDPQEGPEALDYQKSPRVGECPQLIPPFLGSPGRKQPEPLPTVETS